MNDSDSSDEDYVPDKEAAANLSEEETDDEVDKEESPKKRAKQASAPRKKAKLEAETEDKPKESNIEDIWADFIKDTGFKSKTQSCSTISKVSVPTAETSNATKPSSTVLSEKSSPSAKPTPPKPSQSTKSGLGSILNQLGKKSKVSTLEKSKLDWDQFKKEENIEEELSTYNKGKDGYLERQDFLTRADFRRFEIEKQLRTVERSKRDNN